MYPEQEWKWITVCCLVSQERGTWTQNRSDRGPTGRVPKRCPISFDVMSGIQPVWYTSLFVLCCRKGCVRVIVCLNVSERDVEDVTIAGAADSFSFTDQQ